MPEGAGNTAGEMNVVITANADPVVNAAAQAEESLNKVGTAGATAGANLDSGMRKGRGGIIGALTDLRQITRILTLGLVVPRLADGLASTIDKAVNAAQELKQKFSDIAASYSPQLPSTQNENQLKALEEYAKLQIKINSLHSDYNAYLTEGATLIGMLTHKYDEWFQNAHGAEELFKAMQDAENAMQRRADFAIKEAQAIRDKNRLLEQQIKIFQDLQHVQEQVQDGFRASNVQFSSDRAAGLGLGDDWSKSIAARLGGG